MSSEYCGKLRRIQRVFLSVFILGWLTLVVYLGNYISLRIFSLARISDEVIGDVSSIYFEPFDTIPVWLASNRYVTVTHEIMLPLVFSLSDADEDGDGILNRIELRLQTNPNSIDSDCDYASDKDEIGDIHDPTDTDADSLINAIESSLLDSNGNGVNDQIDPTVGPQLNCARFMPFAITTDGSQSASLEAHIVGGAEISEVTAMVNVAGFITPTLDATLLNLGDQISLYDDGSNGDLIANDGVWTKGRFGLDREDLDPHTAYTFHINQFVVTDNGVTLVIDRVETGPNSSFNQVPLFFVHPSAVQTATQMLTETLVLSHLVNLAVPDLALELKQSGGISTEMTQRFYQNFNDEYDFLLFYPDSYAVGTSFGSHISVQNKVENIGVSLFNDSARFGSSGRLKGAVFMNLGGGPILHELLHQWAVNNLRDLGFNQCTDDSHWGVAGVGKGQLGGFDATTLVDMGDGKYSVGSFGTFANGGDSVSYAQIENYLAGFIGPESVAPITVPVNVNCSSIEFNVNTQRVTFEADSLKVVTIDEITKQLGGSRIPDHTVSKKSFSAAFIVLSERLLTPTELAVTHLDAQRLGNVFDSHLFSFSKATNGVGTMDTTVKFSGHIE